MRRDAFITIEQICMMPVVYEDQAGSVLYEFHKLDLLYMACIQQKLGKNRNETLLVLRSTDINTRSATFLISVYGEILHTNYTSRNISGKFDTFIEDKTEPGSVYVSDSDTFTLTVDIPDKRSFETVEFGDFSFTVVNRSVFGNISTGLIAMFLYGISGRYDGFHSLHFDAENGENAVKIYCNEHVFARVTYDIHEVSIEWLTDVTAFTNSDLVDGVLKEMFALE